MDQDQEHLRLLSLFHYIVGGLCGLFACFPIFHVIMGIAILNGAFPKAANQPEFPPGVGWLFIGAGIFFILVGWTVAIVIAVAGRMLSKRKYYTFCLVVAAIECMFFPFGTALGVFTIIVLLRPSVKPLFQHDSGSPA